MTLLKDSIRLLASRPFLAPKLREIPFVIHAAAQVTGADGLEVPREGREYEKIIPRLREKLDSGDRLTTRQLRDASWCIWQTSQPLSDDETLLQQLFQQVEASRLRGPGRALASSFMYFFSANRDGIAEASNVLAGLASRLGRPWDQLHSTCKLLDWKAGPATLANLALELRKSPTQLLVESGLRSRDALSGYVEVCAAEALQRLAAMQDVSATTRLALVREIGLSEDGRLMFAAHAPLVANALLVPFKENEPNDRLKQEYLDLVLSLFKDPRLHPGNWVRMEEAADIVRRWLTKESLRQFLDVVDEVAVERMWHYRRKFWNAVYDAGLISDAWVVFDRVGEKVARNAYGKEISFARFDGSVQPGQSVLLLRIGRGVVAEWSHNGKCNIWNEAEDKAAPPLYRRYYIPSHLRSNGSTALIQSTFAVVHATHTGPNSWQGKVAAKLYQMTGFKLKSSDWM